MKKTTDKTTSKDRRSRTVKPLKLLAVGLAIAAVIKELRLPPEQRTWHGALGGFVPYDFRMPTLEKLRKTFWNPTGKIIVGRPFGVGWTLNLGALVAKVRSLAGSA